MSVPTSFTFSAENDQYIEWGPMVDGLTGITLGDGTQVAPAYLNNLTGTATLLDATGAPVTGANALPFVYVPASNGIYRALVEQTFNPPVGGGYKLVIVFTAPGSEPRGDYKATVPARVAVKSTP
jgi:hypothetical protein